MRRNHKIISLASFGAVSCLAAALFWNLPVWADQSAFTDAGMVRDPVSGKEYRQIDWRADGIYQQINRYEDGSNGMILLYLSGIPETELPVPLTGQEHQTASVVQAYLRSYDWREETEEVRLIRTISFILNRAVYDTEAEEDQTSWACLVQGRGTCGSFMNGFHLLTRAVGLDSLCVARGDHGWNCVKVDGIWYEADLSALSQALDQHHDDTLILDDIAGIVLGSPMTEERKQDLLWSLYLN